MTRMLSISSLLTLFFIRISNVHAACPTGSFTVTGTSLADNAYSACATITAVTIPATLTSIGSLISYI